MIQAGHNAQSSERGEGVNHYYCYLGFWRASDQAAVARHLADRTRMSGDPDLPRRVGLVRSTFLRMLRMAGLAKRPVETRSVEHEEPPARESCACGGEEFGYRQPVLDEGEWVLRCPKCGHLDRLRWLSDEARPLMLGLARRGWGLRRT